MFLIILKINIFAINRVLMILLKTRGRRQHMKLLYLLPTRGKRLVLVVNILLLRFSTEELFPSILTIVDDEQKKNLLESNGQTKSEKEVDANGKSMEPVSHDGDTEV